MLLPSSRNFSDTSSELLKALSETAANASNCFNKARSNAVSFSLILAHSPLGNITQNTSSPLFVRQFLTSLPSGKIRNRLSSDMKLT